MPITNTGQFVIEGIVKKTDIIMTRGALKIGEMQGGLTEYVINPAKVNITRVSGANPNF